MVKRKVWLVVQGWPYAQCVAPSHCLSYCYLSSGEMTANSPLSRCSLGGDRCLQNKKIDFLLWLSVNSCWFIARWPKSIENAIYPTPWTSNFTSLLRESHHEIICTFVQFNPSLLIPSSLSGVQSVCSCAQHCACAPDVEEEGMAAGSLFVFSPLGIFIFKT